jgi:hypothetical protein
MQPTMEKMVGVLDLDVVDGRVDRLCVALHRLRIDQLVF